MNLKGSLRKNNKLKNTIVTFCGVTAGVVFCQNLFFKPLAFHTLLKLTLKLIYVLNSAKASSKFSEIETAKWVVLRCDY